MAGLFVPAGQQIVDPGGHPTQVMAIWMQQVQFTLVQIQLIINRTSSDAGAAFALAGSGSGDGDGELVPGPPGATGTPGATGPMGPAGIAAIDGSDGEDAWTIPGPQGPTGNPGATGPPGAIGIGLDGDQGEDAFAIPGPQGPTGATGPSGTIVQVVSTQSSAVATGSTVIPFDDSIPQNTEGDEYITLAITPTNTSSVLRIEANIMASSDTAARAVSVALFQDTTANALAAVGVSGANVSYTIPLNYTMTAGTTSSTTFKIRVGLSAGGGTLTFNGSSTARRYGAIPKSSIVITEIAP